MIKIVAVGRIKERYIGDGIQEYAKRLTAYGGVRVTEVKDSDPKEEGERILKALGDDYAVVLDEKGKQLTSVELASLLKRGLEKDISFVIGGPEGLSDEVKKRSDLLLSLSKMTYTHELARLILFEQIYRAHMINSGRRYHR